MTTDLVARGDGAGHRTEDASACGEAEPAPRARRKKGAQAVAREALRQHAEQDASRSVREIYRKLVSELHPDREWIRWSARARRS